VGRSADAGQTWSESRVFDELGVSPLHLLLPANGLTLASYGRPVLFVRATADSAWLECDE